MNKTVVMTIALAVATWALAAPTHFRQLVTAYAFEGGLQVTTQTRAPAPLARLIQTQTAALRSALTSKRIKGFTVNCNTFEQYRWSDTRYGTSATLERRFTQGTLAVMERLKVNDFSISFAKNEETAAFVTYNVSSTLIANSTVLVFIDKSLRTPNATTCDYTVQR